MNSPNIFCSTRAQPARPRKRKPSRSTSVTIKDVNKKSDKESKSSAATDAEIYGELDPSLTLLIHGVESDFIEEQMADDEDFRFFVINYNNWHKLKGSHK